MTNTQPKAHYIADESLGGLEREYVEVPERKADVGDYVVIFGSIATVYEETLGACRLENERGKAHSWFDTSDYITLSPTDIVRHRGERFMLANREARIGEEVVALDGDVAHDGKVGEVVREWEEGAISANIDDNLEYYPYLYVEDYRVLIPIVDAEPTQAPPRTTDGIIANLIGRLTKAEQKIENLEVGADTLADRTYVNEKDIRTWAESHEKLKYKVGVIDDYQDTHIELLIEHHDKLEMLTDDIVTLDERTQILTKGSGQ